MENLNNLPSFYVGQKVVYIGRYKELIGSIHTITKVYKIRCGCYIVETDNLSNDDYNTCSDCGCRIYIYGKVGMASSFKPLQESVFPSLTMSKVLEKESQLISMN